MIDHKSYISTEPGKRSGKPSVRGLRITVYDILSMLAEGLTHEDILNDFPEITNEDILACLSFAADREHRTVATHR